MSSAISFGLQATMQEGLDTTPFGTLKRIEISTGKQLTASPAVGIERIRARERY
jgi:hypothetical protein